MQVDIGKLCSAFAFLCYASIAGKILMFSILLANLTMLCIYTHAQYVSDIDTDDTISIWLRDYPYYANFTKFNAMLEKNLCSGRWYVSEHYL